MKWLAACGGFLCLLLCAGCSRSTLLEDAERAQRRWDMPKALQLARWGRALSIVSANPESDWKFRCVEADAENAQAEWTRAAALLADRIPRGLAGTPAEACIEIDRGASQASLLHFAEAQQHFAAAGRLCQIPAIAHLQGELALRRALLAFLQHDYALSDTLAQQAVTFARRNGQPVLEARAMTFVGALRSYNRHWVEAVSWLQPAVEAAVRLNIPALIEKNYGNLGFCYYNVGDLDSALDNYRKAERFAREAGVRNDRRQWLTDLGLVYEDRADFPTASKYDFLALALAREGKDPTAIAECLHNVGDHAFDRQDYRTAESFNRQEIGLKVKIHDKSGELYARYLEGFLLERNADHPHALRTFQKIIDESGDDKSLRWQAQIALAQVHIAMGQPDRARSAFDQAIATFEQARKSLNADEFKLIFRNGLNGYYSTYVKFLMDQNKPFDALKVAELSRAQVLAERLGVAESSGLDLAKLQAVARALDAAVFSYWLAPGASYLWVITPGDFHALTLPPGPSIERMVESYQAGIASSNPSNDTRLYQALIEPARQYLPASGRVILIPDGKLFEINFETLLVPGGPQPHYWIEDATVSTATTLALLKPREKRSPHGGILLIGNPVPPRPEFPALPYSGAEIDAIARRFPAPQRAIFQGAAATPVAYRNARPGAYSWIHFAAHGVASKESPLDSAIVLSNEGDSFRLYARDITKLPLTADLVTISACYTSGTRTFSGEGIVGLAWAFLLAGAHNVVASLWEANDYYTAQLMDRMYERLRAGDDAAAALRNAKLSLVHSEFVCRNPRYWGAFQIYTGY
jgi:CHAT domain-containing protein